jgi:hypothetical protein
MALPYSHTWTGTNGDPWSADWTTSNSGGTTLDIQSNQGRILTGSLGGYADYGRALLADQGEADFDETVDIVVGVQEEKYANVGFRTDRAWHASNAAWPQNGYGVEFGVHPTPASGFWSVERVDASSRTGLSGQTSYTMTAGDTVHVNVRCDGGDVEVRIWKNAEGKPGSATYSFTDSTHDTRTGHQVGLNGGGGATDDIYFDNLAIDPIGAPPVVQPGTYIQQLGTAATTSATGPPNTLAISFSGATKPAVGDLVVFYCARDNIINDPATGDTFDDGEGNTYTRVALAQPSGTSTANAGIVGVMFYTVVTAAWTGTNTLTWTMPTGTADRVMLAEHYQGPIRGLRGTADTAGSTTSVSVLTTDPLAGDLVVAMSAYEHSAASTVTGDSDTTNGSWSTQTTQLPSGGTTTAAVKVVAQWKLVTATGNQSYATSNSTNTDNVGIVATFIPGYPYRGRQPTQAARGSAINSNFY